MNPAVPTREPAMMSTLLLSTHPCPAAASPEYELSRAITTGMSAPPMGSTRKMPRTAATGTRSQNGTEEVGSRTSQTLRPKQTNANATLIACRPGRRMGRSGMRPWSLPKAMALPVKATPPIRPAPTEGYGELDRYFLDESALERFFQRGADCQGRGATTEAVEDGDDLGDAGHGDAIGHDRPDQRSRYQPHDDNLEADDALVQQGDHDGHEHARRAE